MCNLVPEPCHKLKSYLLFLKALFGSKYHKFQIFHTKETISGHSNNNANNGNSLFIELFNLIKENLNNLNLLILYRENFALKNIFLK